MIANMQDIDKLRSAVQDVHVPLEVFEWVYCPFVFYWNYNRLNSVFYKKCWSDKKLLSFEYIIKNLFLLFNFYLIW